MCTGIKHGMKIFFFTNCQVYRSVLAKFNKRNRLLKLFCFRLDNFYREGRGKPKSKHFLEHFSDWVWTFFKEKGGGLPIFFKGTLLSGKLGRSAVPSLP